MSAIEPAGDKIVRNLQEAVERLHDDIARIEIWADALSCFSKPVPEYEAAQAYLNNFVLPGRTAPKTNGENLALAARQAGRNYVSSKRKNGPERDPAEG
jgi:hypothetical protein